MSAPTTTRLVVAGVGGQGALTAGRLVGEAAMLAGFEVMVGQLHGMSQRGGPVECSVVMGPARSAHVGAGAAELLLGLEPMEARRALPYVGAQTRVLVSAAVIVPFELAIRGKPYPQVEQLLEPLRRRAAELRLVDARALALQAGLVRTMNVVMLGALAGLEALPFAGEYLWQAVERRIKPRFLQVNRRAFDLGRRVVLTGN